MLCVGNNVAPASQKVAQHYFTSIEPAMGCDAGPTLNRYWVGRPTLCVRDTSYKTRMAMDGGGRNRPTR